VERRFAVTRILLAIALGGGLLASDGLLDAVRRNDSRAIRRELARGASADAKDTDGVPALMLAALFADVEAMKALLAGGADVNAVNGAGATALLWSVPDLEKVRLLVSRRADVNARSTNLGRTALLVAANYPATVPVLRFLLEHGADLRARDRNGASALNLAVRASDIGVVRFLVERGLDVNESSPGGALPLSPALGRSYLPTIEFLLAKGGRADRRALTLSTYWLPPSIVSKLIEQGAEVNTRDSTFGRTPLLSAAASEQSHIETLRLLLKKGADPTVADTDGETPLDWAMHAGNEAKIALLREYSTKTGETPRDRTYPKPEGIADARASVTRAVAALLPTAAPVFKRRGCITCHNQSMVAQASAAAREKGIAVDEALERQNLKQMLAVYKPSVDQSMQGVLPAGGELTVGYIAMGLHAQKHPLDKITAALSHVVASKQMPEGTWVETISRPPMEYSSISRTAMAVRTITLYPIPARTGQQRQVLERARKWMVEQKPASAEEQAMRLMALDWTGASSEFEAAARSWIAQQRPDGGWSQLPHLEPDAYATGITLVALERKHRDPAYRRGIDWLLKNQYADGTWFVKTRSFPVQPQQESGYPFGYNQWISAAAACWSTLAIAKTLP
jgi:ankyrin repeat protein